jgi:hypothetical protein
LARRDTSHESGRIITSDAPIDDNGVPGGEPVEYERVEYRQTATLECRGGSAYEASGFDEMVFEAWGSTDAARWRERVTYPDGSTFDVIATDSPYYPKNEYRRGEAKGGKVGCRIGEENHTLVAAPGQRNFTSINPLAPVPTIPSMGMPARLGYAELGTRVGDATDSRGRAAILWRKVITGGHLVAGEMRPVMQTSEWFVDATGTVLESSYENQIPGVGVAKSTSTVTDRKTTTVDKRIFATNGYEKSDGDMKPPTTNTRPCVSWMGGRADGVVESGTRC